MAATETPQQVQATAKWVRSSARKARLVTDLIRGRSVPEARTVLAFSQRAVARDVEKVLRSAVANAEANNGWNGDELFVVTAYADEGPTLKRWRARARGRVARIRKRTCHITVRLAPTEQSGLGRGEEQTLAASTRVTAESETTPPAETTAAAEPDAPLAEESEE